MNDFIHFIPEMECNLHMAVVIKGYIVNKCVDRLLGEGIDVLILLGQMGPGTGRPIGLAVLTGFRL